MNTGESDNVLFIADRQAAGAGEHNGIVSVYTSVNPGVEDTIDVSITVPPPDEPLLSLNPDRLEFGENDTLKYSQFGNIGEGTLNWTAVEDIEWLRVQPENGNIETQQSSNVAFISDRTGLESGQTYSDMVFIRYDDKEDTVFVSVSVPEEPPVLVIDPRDLNFGEQESVLNVQIGNSGGRTLNWAVSEDIDWLIVAPVEGSVAASDTQEVTFIADRDGLESGRTFEGIVRITSNGGSDSIAVIVQTPEELPELSVDPHSVDFGENETERQLTIGNIGQGTLSWRVSEGVNWLSATPISGEANAGDSDVIQLTADRGSLNEGDSPSTYLRITSNGGNDSVQAQLSVPYTIPNAPGNLVAEAVDTNRIDLSWEDNSDNETGFRIQRKLEENDEWLEIAEVGENVTTFEDGDLEPNTAYYYRAMAFNPAGNSNPSHEADAITLPVAGSEREFPLGDTGLNIVMCWIPAGEFWMGAQEGEEGAGQDEFPRHRVMFDYGFWMGKYEITQQQWVAVMGDWEFNFPGHPNFPAERLNTTEIQEFIEDLNGSFRLPSESEWEYACRAGTQTRFYWGNDPDYEEIDLYAWYLGNSNQSPHPVGVDKRPNNWGLFNMSGNIAEFCKDIYHSSFEGNPPNDGSAWLEGGNGNPVVRHGHWNNAAPECRSASRGSTPMNNRSLYIGFRLVRDE